MTRIFTSGAEEMDIQALWDEIDWASGALSHTQLRTTGYSSIVTFSPRTGAAMYALTSSLYLRKDFGSSTYTELFWGLATRFSVLTAASFFYAYTDDQGVYGNFLTLKIETTGAISVTRTGATLATSAAGVISINTWHYIEVWFKPLNSNGRAVVYVDGVKVIDYTGDTTGEDEWINAWQIIGNSSSSDYLTYFDDIVCNDASGSANNTYPGQVRLMPIRPNSSGSNTAWTRAGTDLGSDEAQLRNGTFDFTMLQTSSADQKQTFTPEVPDLPVGATISNIVISARARVQSGAGVIAPMIDANGTENISADQTLMSSWKYYQYAWAANPEDSAAWEEADLALLELGISS